MKSNGDEAQGHKKQQGYEYQKHRQVEDQQDGPVYAHGVKGDHRAEQ
jgi:hypothetical protein